MARFGKTRSEPEAHRQTTGAPRADTEPKGAEEQDGKLELVEDWRRRAGSAAKVRLAGLAFTIRIEWRYAGTIDVTPLLGKVRKKAQKILAGDLNKSHRLESVAVEPDALVLAVSANTTYVGGRSLPFSTPKPWPSDVDEAVEAIRREISKLLRPQNDSDPIEVGASWLPGSGVYVEGVTIDEHASARALQERLRELNDLKSRSELLRLLIVGAAVLTGTAGMVIAITTKETFFAAYIVAYGVLALVLLPIPGRRIAATRDEIAANKEQLDLQGLLDDEERRAFRLFQLHNAELKRYYDSALGQRRTIFGLGIFCILLGAGIAIAALIMLGAEHTSTEEQILISGMGAIGAILTNFVAIVYLRMFRDTVASMNVFHTRLVSTHHLLFGNLLAARIGDRAERDETLAKMATAIAGVDSTNGAGQAGAPNSTHPAVP